MRKQTTDGIKSGQKQTGLDIMRGLEGSRWDEALP